MLMKGGADPRRRGFSTVEEVAYVPLANCRQSKPLMTTPVQELRTRARNAALTGRNRQRKSARERGGRPQDAQGVDTELLMKLSRFGITTRDALADLASDELCAIRVSFLKTARVRLIDNNDADLTG